MDDLGYVLTGIVKVVTDNVIVSLCILTYFLSNLFEHRNDVEKLQQVKKRTFIIIGAFATFKLLVVILRPMLLGYYV